MSNLTLSVSPHIRGRRTTNTIMLDVIIAMCPVLIMSVYHFGFRALLLVLISAAACVAGAAGAAVVWGALLPPHPASRDSDMAAVSMTANVFLIISILLHNDFVHFTQFRAACTVILHKAGPGSLYKLSTPVCKFAHFPRAPWSKICKHRSKFHKDSGDNFVYYR